MDKNIANRIKSSNYDLKTSEHMFKTGRYIYVLFMCHLPKEDKGVNKMVKKRREIKKIIKRYITELKRLGVEVSQVILFGSYAKGRPVEHSDIDLAVVSPTFYKLDIFERQLILSKAHHKFGEPIEPVGLTPEQFRENKGFIREIINTGIIV